jgi:hypothetical protein
MDLRIGDTGRAVAPMSPSGKVEIGGVRHDARSEGMFIPAGARCVVVRADATGLVVRPVEDGQPAPRFPNHGEPIRKGECKLTPAEAAAVQEQERQQKRRESRRKLLGGLARSVGLGVVIGLGAAVVGWTLGLADHLAPADLAALGGGLALAGVVIATVIYFLTGCLGYYVRGMTMGDPEFAPAYITMTAALVSAAYGFWWRFPTGDVNTIAEGALVTGALAALIVWGAGFLIGLVIDIPT